MSPITATTTGPLEEICSSGQAPTTDQPCYAYVGDGKFEPANAAAWREVNAWNAYATMMTDRSAAARSRHHDH